MARSQAVVRSNRRVPRFGAGDAARVIVGAPAAASRRSRAASRHCRCRTGSGAGEARVGQVTAFVTISGKLQLVAIVIINNEIT
jgi:hypothetical protein